MQVQRLTGHEWWIYDKPGSTGIAHSTPQKIEDIPFGRLLADLRENSSREDDPFRNLLSLQYTLEEGMTELPGDHPIALEFKRRRETILISSGLGDTERNALAASAWLIVNTFCTLTKTNWHILS
ncbi:hypothetical protein [Puia sp.]|uniref:hypothetical protein n=1 Tax=Puia sp. TaxID=2045100 RepID=UPI002F415210